MTRPLPVSEALAHILARCQRLPAEQVALDAARGRVLASDLHSDLDLPPFDNSAVDGYAVHAADLATAHEDSPVTLPLEGVIHAAPGEPPPLPPGHCAKIMTGAPVPAGADAVVMVELTEGDASWVVFRTAPKPGANVRRRGEDLRDRARVLRAGASLGHAEIAILAAVGAAEVPVTRHPRVLVISTGDELVPVTERPGPGQLRDSSRHALPAQLTAAGGEVVGVEHAVDSAEALQARLTAVRGADIVVTTGGVSMGDRDFVRPVFERVGEKDFWRVAIKPGKPLLFGRLGDALFFGLPGNPVSSMVCADVFIRPAMDALLGRTDGGRVQLTGRAAADFPSDAGRAEYVRVYAWPQNGIWMAEPTGDQSSGRMTSMLGANAYAVVPEGVAGVASGEAVMLELYDKGPGA